LNCQKILFFLKSGWKRVVEVGSKKQKSDEVKEKPVSSQPQEQFRGGIRYNTQKATAVSSYKNEPRIDVSDENRWKMASMLVRHFPGIITEIQKNQ
jgi:hypothetical protein